MGRIEDALAKLQSGAAASGATRPHLPLARVSDAIALPGQQHNYGGKFVEVDFRALRTQGLLAPDAQERRLEEEYRVIKRPLIKNASSGQTLERPNLLMVASANSGEGKTFTCVNLCLSIAREKDWTVVLVDGDGSKPAESTYAEVGNIQGESKPGAGEGNENWIELQSMSSPIQHDSVTPEPISDLDAPTGGSQSSDVDGDDYLSWQENNGNDPADANELLTDDTSGAESHIQPTKQMDSASPRIADDPAGSGPSQISMEDTPDGEGKALEIKLENAQISSYQLGVLDSDSVEPVDELVGNANDQNAAGRDDTIQIESWSWGETNEGGEPGPDDLTVEEDVSEAKKISGSVGKGGKNAGTFDDDSRAFNQPEIDPLETPRVGANQSETIGANQTAPVGDGSDPDQPLIVGQVPNKAGGAGLRSDGELVQAVSDNAVAGDDGLDEVPTEMVSMNLSGDQPEAPGDLAGEGDGQVEIQEDIAFSYTQIKVDYSEKGEDVAMVQELMNPIGAGEGVEPDGIVGPKTTGVDPEPIDPDGYMDDELPSG